MLPASLTLAHRLGLGCWEPLFSQPARQDSGPYHRVHLKDPGMQRCRLCPLHPQIWRPKAKRLGRADTILKSGQLLEAPASEGPVPVVLASDESWILCGAWCCVCETGQERGHHTCLPRVALGQAGSAPLTGFSFCPKT